MRTGKERIQVTEQGFSIYNGQKHLGDITWNNIKQVAAFKEDLLTVDAVCLEIATYVPAQYWVVDDDVAGFWDLSARLKTVLPGYEQDWEQHVVKPAFARNWRVVFKRPCPAK